MKLKINEDTISNLTRDYLIEDYKLLRRQIKILKEAKKQGTLADYAAEDLKADKKAAKAFKEVIAYYTTASDLAFLLDEARW